MVSQACKLFLTSTVLLLLTACGGGDPTITETVLVYTPEKHAGLERHSTPAPLVLASNASDSARQADALRMVDAEQAQSIELNRRHAEQLEREARIDSNTRAGIVQSPGCEDTVGQDAVICEQRVTRL